MSATYSGSLQVKKKAELQEIAQALAIGDSGTREDLQQRIKKHLEDNNAELENDPAFSGLYTTRGGRRQRSLQPTNAVPHTTHSHVDQPKFTAIPEEKEPSPPFEDLRDASTSIPQSSQTPVASPRVSPRKKLLSPKALLSQSSLPSSPTRTLVTQAQEQSDVETSDAAPQTTHAQTRNFTERILQTVYALRVLLSSSQNIFIVSTLLDFFGILYQIHVNSVFPIPPVYVTTEPALSTTALAALYWALPSVVIPVVVGYFVSFSSPASRPRFDILSSSIIRFAANVPNFYPSIAFLKKDNVQSLDVLGFKWRAVSSGITLAFAFAEAIARRSNEA